MSEMSNKKSLNNDVKEAGAEGEVFSSGRISSAGLVVTPLLLVGNGRKRMTRWLYYVICEQRKDQILVIEKECISTGRTMDSLSWRNNTDNMGT